MFVDYYKMFFFSMIAKALMIFLKFHVSDLVYFVYLNTDKAFRDQHLQTCLKLYYDQFATYFDDNLTYSYEEFLEEFHRFKNIGFTTACSVMPNILSDKSVDIQGNPITAFRELQRKQVKFRTGFELWLRASWQGAKEPELAILKYEMIHSFESIWLILRKYDHLWFWVTSIWAPTFLVFGKGNHTQALLLRCHRL